MASIAKPQLILSLDAYLPPVFFPCDHRDRCTDVPASEGPILPCLMTELAPSWCGAMFGGPRYLHALVVDTYAFAGLRTRTFLPPREARSDSSGRPPCIDVVLAVPRRISAVTCSQRFSCDVR